MSHAKTQSRKEVLLAAFLLVTFVGSCPHASAQDAILANSERLRDTRLVRAAFDGTTSTASLLVDGERRDANDLVRWGQPAPPARRPGVTLANGSRVLADRAWAPNGLVQVEDEQIRLRRGMAWLNFDRDSVRWILLSPGMAGLDQEKLPEMSPNSDDLVLLAGGDRLAGRINSLAAGSLTITVAGQPIETPLENVAAVRLADTGIDPGSSACLVGLDDGSLLHASRLLIDEDLVEIALGDLTITAEPDTLAFVQPLGGPVQYLSDFEPVDYRHTPYLDLVWPYACDRGLRGGPLVGGGRRAAKGVAMHSAARLVYRLDGSAQRFRAELAVAEPEPGSAPSGSVAFRVYLVKDGGFQAAYEGPTQRVGDPAVPIDIDTTGAAALALVIDYADGGDAGDDALWLDARLVR